MFLLYHFLVYSKCAQFNSNTIDYNIKQNRENYLKRFHDLNISLEAQSKKLISKSTSDIMEDNDFNVKNKNTNYRLGNENNYQFLDIREHSKLTCKSVDSLNQSLYNIFDQKINIKPPTGYRMSNSIQNGIENKNKYEMNLTEKQKIQRSRRKNGNLAQYQTRTDQFNQSIGVIDESFDFDHLQKRTEKSGLLRSNDLDSRDCNKAIQSLTPKYSNPYDEINRGLLVDQARNYANKRKAIYFKTYENLEDFRKEQKDSMNQDKPNPNTCKIKADANPGLSKNYKKTYARENQVKNYITTKKINQNIPYEDVFYLYERSLLQYDHVLKKKNIQYDSSSNKKYQESSNLDENQYDIANAESDIDNTSSYDKFDKNSYADSHEYMSISSKYQENQFSNAEKRNFKYEILPYDIIDNNAVKKPIQTYENNTNKNKAGDKEHYENSNNKKITCIKNNATDNITHISNYHNRENVKSYNKSVIFENNNDVFIKQNIENPKNKNLHIKSKSHSNEVSNRFVKFLCCLKVEEVDDFYKIPSERCKNDFIFIKNQGKLENNNKITNNKKKSTFLDSLGSKNEKLKDSNSSEYGFVDENPEQKNSRSRDKIPFYEENISFNMINPRINQTEEGSIVKTNTGAIKKRFETSI